MSSPRAAMSVATRMSTRPALKSLRARTRCGWLLLPWIAAAAIPSRTSCSERRLAPCFVRVKTSAWRIAPVRISRLRSSRLRSRSTGWTTWRTSSAGVLRRATSTVAGRSRKPSASRRISSENVAEKSRFWRFTGSRARIFRMSRMKPMSSIRSASSSTRISTRERSMVRWFTWSRSRPGVATTISGPARSARTCGSNPTPP